MTTAIDLRDQLGTGPIAISRGAALAELWVPDGTGGVVDVLLGYQSHEDYRGNRYLLGSVVGRYAGRIAGASFAIDGQRYQLNPNAGTHLLHGGSDRFSMRDWSGELGEGSATFSLTSPDDDQGFPGELAVSATYRWIGGQCLEIEFAATTTKPSPLNLTHHGYWNLGGPDVATVLEHWLTIDADHYLPLNPDLTPTGEIRSVAGTPFDFRNSQRIRDVLALDHVELRSAGGLDHCWVLNGTGYREVARLVDPVSARAMTLSTDQPGLQVYSANAFDGGPPGKVGVPHARHAGIALEAQHFPDSVNQPHFPDTILRLGETFLSRTSYGFAAG